MSKHTLLLEEDYSLIGIHSSEEDYRLAYLLNLNLNTKFIRYNDVLDFENSNAHFTIFEFDDEINYIKYYLISNKHINKSDSNQSNSLFSRDISTLNYLIPEKKNVDYFLKIEGGNSDFFIDELCTNLKKIKQVITAYLIEPSSLKSKNNLIF